MRICGLTRGEPTTRFELVTYRLRIEKWVLIISNLQERCADVAFLAFFYARTSIFFDTRFRKLASMSRSVMPVAQCGRSW